MPRIAGKTGPARCRLLGLALAAAVSATAVPAAASGFLSLESNPSGAEVWYAMSGEAEKKYLGDTPVQNRELPAGQYHLWLILQNHDTLALPDVFIAEGQHTQITREIPTHYGYLEVNTEPDSAEIWLDGVKIGPTPYVNNLVLPGQYRLRVIPREAHYRVSARKVVMGKADSLHFSIPSPYRSKSFFLEGLSLPPWRLEVDAGIQFRSMSGVYDTAGKSRKFQDSLQRKQWDFPLAVHIGLPQGFEFHLMLPFKSADKKDSLKRAPFQSNGKAGIKYTYRPYNVGMDVSYELGFKNNSGELNHDVLDLTLLGMASKGKITGSAQAGFEFHFSEKDNNQFDPGDVAWAHAQVGYSLGGFLPYLGLTGRFRLSSDFNGTSNQDAGYVLIPEPGAIVDVADLASLQFGIPFSLVGKRDANFWGMHVSLNFGFNLDN